MKKTFLLLLALLFTTNGFCQDLEFLGIPINGPKDVFSRQLLEKGFRYIPDDPDSSLAGTFYDEPCVLKLKNKNDAVNTINIILMPNDNWLSIYTKYKSIKMKLAKEYGKPTKDEEIFDTKKEPKNDIQKYEELNKGNCQYQCYWFTPNVGGIAISILHLISGENTVTVSYIKMDELLSDEDIPHLKFKGISMDCPANEFAYNLERQGYTYVTKVDETHILKGAFAGYSNCQIFITSSQYNNIVDHVAVNFPDQTKWEYLFNTYMNLKKMLSEKYGAPASCIEKFVSYSEPTSDRKKMNLLHDDKCKYETIYYVNGSFVKLIISHLFFNYEHKTYVSLIYMDGATHFSTSKKAADDL